MDKDKFREKVKARVEMVADNYTLETLKLMLEKDVKMFDAHYIQKRSLEIVEKGIEKLNFRSTAIEKARSAFLDVLVDGVKPYNFKDERKQLMKDVKDKDKKAKAKERLGVLDRLEAGNPRDLTEERDLACEPVCQEIAKMALSKESLADPNYVAGTAEIDNEYMMSLAAYEMVDTLFKLLYKSIDESYLIANEKLWGTPREKIKMSVLHKTMIDEN